MRSSCVQTRLQLFRQLPSTVISADMIERFMQHEPASATLYAVTAADSRIVVTDNRAVAVVAQDPDAPVPLLTFAPIGRLRPYAHCLRRFVLGSYLAGGNYDALTETYGDEACRVTRGWLDAAIEAVGDAGARRMLHRRGKDAVAKRSFESLLTSINRGDTLATAGNGINGRPIPWCAAIIAAVAARIVASHHPCSIPHVKGFNICLDPLSEVSS